MKRLLFVSLLFVQLVLCSPRASAQILVDSGPWCPPGATWIYSTIGSPLSRIYFKFVYEADTIIQGISVKRIAFYQIDYTGIPQEPPLRRSSRKIWDEYMYASHDSVFWYDAQQARFLFMYRFNAAEGDYFVIGNPRENCPGDPTFPAQDTVWVTKVFTDTISNRIYNVSLTSYDKGYQIGLVTSNIGASQSFLPSINVMKCPTAEYRGERLICYSDSLRGFVGIGSSLYGLSECHDISTRLDALLPIPEALPFRPYPNPTRDFVTIETGQRIVKRLRIVNAVGQVLMDKTENSQNPRVTVASLPTGLYYLQVEDDQGRQTLLKLLKKP